MFAEDTVVVIDDVLSQKVLKRIGADHGVVRVSKETWDLGFCETCSYPEEGFAVYVDDELVYPNDESLLARGGYIYADSEGYVSENKLTSWGLFFDWLDGKNLLDVVDEYYDEDNS